MLNSILQLLCFKYQAFLTGLPPFWQAVCRESRPVSTRDNVSGHFAFRAPLTAMGICTWDFQFHHAPPVFELINLRPLRH